MGRFSGVLSIVCFEGFLLKTRLQKNKTQLMVRSYELGVLISDPARVKLPYDYPVAKYGPKDDPWICDMSYTEADSHGKQWIVSRR
ncbi:hypothetical protein Y032_0243g3501 [Ancylostoma ceylanicum]|uniref:Uncharacterized protein n=1 Tax=Ancylostoma ceylanicum TaxID=53326 RepID=A0A016SE68_9BILA|nr:hypothetical protein Y032_0243g3501 [Ancylostoma ceylanicum]